MTIISMKQTFQNPIPPPPPPLLSLSLSRLIEIPKILYFYKRGALMKRKDEQFFILIACQAYFKESRKSVVWLNFQERKRTINFERRNLNDTRTTCISSICLYINCICLFSDSSSPFNPYKPQKVRDFFIFWWRNTSFEDTLCYKIIREKKYVLISINSVFNKIWDAYLIILDSIRLFKFSFKNIRKVMRVSIGEILYYMCNYCN